MSVETIKKLIWSSNVFFFGSKKIDKKSFIWFYSFLVFMALSLVYAVI